MPSNKISSITIKLMQNVRNPCLWTYFCFGMVPKFLRKVKFLSSSSFLSKFKAFYIYICSSGHQPQSHTATVFALHFQQTKCQQNLNSTDLLSNKQIVLQIFIRIKIILHGYPLTVCLFEIVITPYFIRMTPIGVSPFPSLKVVIRLINIKCQYRLITWTQSCPNSRNSQQIAYQINIKKFYRTACLNCVDWELDHIQILIKLKANLEFQFSEQLSRIQDQDGTLIMRCKERIALLFDLHRQGSFSLNFFQFYIIKRFQKQVQTIESFEDLAGLFANLLKDIHQYSAQQIGKAEKLIEGTTYYRQKRQKSKKKSKASKAAADCLQKKRTTRKITTKKVTQKQNRKTFVSQFKELKQTHVKDSQSQVKTSTQLPKQRQGTLFVHKPSVRFEQANQVSTANTLKEANTQLKPSLRQKKYNSKKSVRLNSIILTKKQHCFTEQSVPLNQNLREVCVSTQHFIQNTFQQKAFHNAPTSIKCLFLANSTKQIQNSKEGVEQKPSIKRKQHRKSISLLHNVARPIPLSFSSIVLEEQPICYRKASMQQKSLSLIKSLKKARQQPKPKRVPKQVVTKLPKRQLNPHCFIVERKYQPYWTSIKTQA